MPIPTKPHQPQARHRAFRADALAVLKKHAGHLTAQEMLALAAHLVGQIIAMQDQRIMSSDMAMQIVIDNIEQGNMEALQQMDKPAGQA